MYFHTVPPSPNIKQNNVLNHTPWERCFFFFRKRYYQTKRRYVVFVGCVLIQFIGIALPSTMLGIVYVDITREFRTDASQAALMLSLFRGISFGGGTFNSESVRTAAELSLYKSPFLKGNFTKII